MDDYEDMSSSDDPLGVDENLSMSDLDASDMSGSGLTNQLLSTGTQLLTGLSSTAKTPAQSAPLAPVQGAVVSTTTSNNAIVWVVVALVIGIILYKVL
jgi:hypothetical protein